MAQPTLTVSEQHDGDGDLLYTFTVHGATHSRRAVADLAATLQARTVWAVAAHQQVPDDQGATTREVATDDH